MSCITGRVGEFDLCSKVNVWEDVGRFVGEVSRKAKKCKRDFEFKHFVWCRWVRLMKNGNLTSEILLNFAKPSRLVARMAN